MKREDINYWLHDSPVAKAERAMSSTEAWEVEQAAGTIARLRELVKAGKVPLECAFVVGESIAMLEMLSASLAIRSA